MIILHYMDWSDYLDDEVYVSKKVKTQEVLDEMLLSQVCRDKCLLLASWLPLITDIRFTSNYEGSYMTVEFSTGRTFKMENEMFIDYIIKVLIEGELDC